MFSENKVFEYVLSFADIGSLYSNFMEAKVQFSIIELFQYYTYSALMTGIPNEKINKNTLFYIKEYFKRKYRSEYKDIKEYSFITKLDLTQTMPIICCFATIKAPAGLIYLIWFQNTDIGTLDPESMIRVEKFINSKKARFAESEF